LGRTHIEASLEDLIVQRIADGYTLVMFEHIQQALRVKVIPGCFVDRGLVLPFDEPIGELRDLLVSHSRFQGFHPCDEARQGTEIRSHDRTWRR
jgi:hypothetical protein